MSGERRRVLILEAAAGIGGGQRVTLDLIESLRDEFRFFAAVPAEGAMAEALAKTGAEVHVLPYPAPEWKFGLRDRLAYLPDGLRALRPLGRLIRETQPHLIYTASRPAPWAALAGWRRGIPVVVHLHLIPATGRTGAFLRWVARTPSVKRVVIAASAIDGRARLPSSKVVLVPNGVGAARFAHDPRARERVRREQGVGEKAFLVGVVGELAPDKGQGDAVEALGLLRQRGFDVELAVVGAARAGLEGYAAGLRSQAARLGLAKVHFTGHRSDMPSVLSALDCLAVPSKGPSGEACPKVVLEAFAAGVPVAASRVSGLPELLDGGRGVLFEPGDPDALATRLEGLLREPSLARQMVEAGRAAATNDYSMERFADRMRAVLGGAMTVKD